nr:hypothetical protein [Tanacetum cinerariifolium]
MNVCNSKKNTITTNICQRANTYAEQGAVKLIAALERQHAEMMKMLSRITLTKDQTSPNVGKLEISNLKNKDPENNNRFDESGYAYFRGKHRGPQNYERFGETYPNDNGNKGGYQGSNHRMRNLKMPLFNGGDAYG